MIRPGEGVPPVCVKGTTGCDALTCATGKHCIEYASYPGQTLCLPVY
jgi:hypothetical protein